MGSDRRDSIFISPEDAEKRRLKNGDPITLTSQAGSFNGVVHLSPVKPGSLQAYWPEVNVLIPRKYDPISGEPDYNTSVTLQKQIQAPRVGNEGLITKNK